MLEFYPAESAEMEVEDLEREANLDVSHYKFSSLQSAPLEALLLNTSSTSSRKEQVTLLKETMQSILALLR